MKRVLPIALATGAVIVGGILIVPSFMDWNKYKPEIIAQAKDKAGYDIAIDGDIGLSLLPSPRLKLEGLTVAAPRGSEKNLLSMKQADVSVKLLPLLSGGLVIDTVRLVNPDIRLEKLSDGTNSWMSDRLNQESDAEGSAPSKSRNNSEREFSLGKLTIDGGSISYVDRASNATYKATDINMDIGAGSARGPFMAEGDLTYDGKKIRVDLDADRMTPGKTDVPVEVALELPDTKAKASFKGIVAPEPLEIQGKLSLNADNLAAVLDDGNSQGALARKISFNGLVTANEQSLQSQDVEIVYGDTSGTGNFAVSGLKDKNPVKIDADMNFKGLIDLDGLSTGKAKPDQKSLEEKVAKGEKLSASSGAFLPENVKTPFPLDGTVRFNAEAVKSGGVTYKGLTARAAKSGPTIDGEMKILEMPGKTNINSGFSVRFGSVSKTGDTGLVYIDPVLTFTAAGASEQLPSLLRAYSPDQENNAAFEIYKTARFDLNGTVQNETAVIEKGLIKLDQTTIGLAAGYKPKGVGGRPDISIDLTTDAVDLDYVTSRLSGQKRQVVQEETQSSPSIKTAVEPIRSFNMPVNLTFDVSAQRAIYQQKPVTGIRIKGRASGSALTLDNASVQDYAGAAASLKGSVSDLQSLSGVDLSFYGKTGNVKALMETFKMDASKVPSGVSSAEASIKAKGSADSMAFDASIVALNGQLKAAGEASSLLGEPQFTNLTVGASHPSLVRAIQIINPAFAGGPGLEQPFQIETKAVKTGQTYNLTGLSASIGETGFTGDLEIDTGSAKPSVSGTINAGTLALDSLLGASDAGGKSASPARTGGGGGGESKWSRETLETGWMQSMNVDLGLSANSIIYGGWNFTNPSTRLTLKDGSLLVDKLKGGLFGGTVQLDAKVVDPADIRQPLSLNVQSRMEKVDVELLAAALSGSNRIKAAGDVSLDFNVQSSGLSPYALVSSLQGKANLGGNNIVMRGFDLAQIGLAFVDTGKPLDRLNSLVGGATQGGETRFDTVSGAYDIADGIVSISSMSLDGPAANIVSKGTVNLPRWSIDTTHTITFKQARDAGAFDVAIKGPLDSPANTFGRGIFNDVLTRRLQQKAVEKLPDVLGKDLTGKLQGLGILPPQQQVPVQQPVTPTVQESAPSNQQQAPVEPQQAPEAAPSQAPVQEDPAEKAIRGVLDGLLR